MKPPFTVILATLIWSFGFSQNFSKTDKYEVTVDEYTLDTVGRQFAVNCDTIYIRLLTSMTEEEIFKTPLYEAEFYDGHEIEISSDNRLKGIDHVIRLTTAYYACCVDETSYYFLVTEDMKFMPLPDYTETFCDGPEPYKEYTFDEDLIQLIHFYPNQENEIDSTKTLETFRLENGKLKEEK